jgi:hypothetical protein
MRSFLLVTACALLGALTSAAPPPPAAPPPATCFAPEQQATPREQSVGCQVAQGYQVSFRYSMDEADYDGYDLSRLCYAYPVAGAVQPALPAAQATVGRVWPAPPPLVAYRQEGAIKFKQPPCSYRPARFTDYIT